jgi:hypothetical protein
MFSVSGIQFYKKGNTISAKCIVSALGMINYIEILHVKSEFSSLVTIHSIHPDLSTRM